MVWEMLFYIQGIKKKSQLFLSFLSPIDLFIFLDESIIKLII